MVSAAFALIHLATSCLSLVFGILESMSEISSAIMVTFEHSAINRSRDSLCAALLPRSLAVDQGINEHARQTIPGEDFQRRELQVSNSAQTGFICPDKFLSQCEEGL
jgi:hypothetical protein